MLTLLVTLSLLPGPVWTLTHITPAGQAGFVLGPRVSPPRLNVPMTGTPGSRTLEVTGTTGCSPLKAHMTLRGTAVRFTAIHAGTTERCPDHALSLREDFLRLLTGATRYERRGDTLMLSGLAGQLTFTARPAQAQP
ncbi:META domain-containing protein [Deinococcus navajonensis]|uniref:META domain-containing protein n=1 Tax=Deinococcus navajonensis TaxID=309884 RepID=A0ABV8XNN9_9DEIO